MPGTIVFFSRVTSEFGGFDGALKSRLAGLRNATVKTPSDIEGYDSGLATLDKLWDFLKSADAVIHLVGTEMGVEPPASMIDEFLARHGEIRSWLQEKRLDFGTWTYTQWEVYLAKFRQHQSGGNTPLIFVCRLDSHGLPDPLKELNAQSSAQTPSGHHLDVLRCLNIHANIHFRDPEGLLVTLMTSAFGALVQRGSQEAVVPLFELAPILGRSDAARALLAWPQLTAGDGRGRWLERPELDRILDRIRDEASSVTLLLGEPGAGKSALLARLAGTCSSHGSVVMPIKADRISEDVEKPEDLTADLGLPTGTDLVTSVTRLAIDGKVVVLMDQLDAIARLIVQKPARLRLLTQVIHDLSGVDNVHIVASCRLFEQRHDPLLSMINAEPIELDLPEWAAVQTVLDLYGINAAGWNTELREALRNPQALATFIELIGEGGEVAALTSYHRMLDRLWERRVLVDGSGRRAQFVHDVAEALTGREALWLPLARFDPERVEIDGLAAAGILRIENGRVGFRHQTLFEHARARSVAANPELLIDTVRHHQGQLRVRPQVWHGLHYLRDVDPHGYHTALAALWDDQDLRKHLRMLLVDFMGSQQAPTAIEVRCMYGALDDPAWQSRALNAMAGSPGWFRNLRTERLPKLMRQDPAQQHSVLQLLLASYAFDQDSALELIRECWLPFKRAALLAWNALSRVPTWTPQAVSDVIVLVTNTDIDDRWIDHLCATISMQAPEAAPRVLRAWLDRQRALDLSDDLDRAGIEQRAAESSFPRLTRCRKVIGHSGLYTASEIAAAAPSAFLDAVWPWFLDVVKATSYGGSSVAYAYRSSPSFYLEFDDEEGIRDPHLVSALDTALGDFAERAPREFLGLLARDGATDSLLVQRLLARALTRIVNREPHAALAFLTSDARRLALGPEPRRHTETWALVRAAFPFLDQEQRSRLEHRMIGWTPYLDVPDEDANTRSSRERWRREHRLLLLRSIPEELRSVELAALVERENADFPDLEPAEAIRTLREVTSPFSVEQMTSMSDDELLEILLELPDSTDCSHPRKLMQGGAVQVGQELGKLAQSYPHRAMGLIRRLPPATHTIHAGYVLVALATAIPAREVYALVLELLRLGFDGDGFRRDVARAVEGIVSAEAPFPEALCESLEAWLVPDPGPWPDTESYDLDRTESMLWRQGGMRVIPATVNRAVLAALGKAYRVCEPPQWSRWMAVFEGHVIRDENPNVWAALIGEIQYVGHADRQRAAAFVDRLLLSQPTLLGSRETALLMYVCFRWAEEHQASTWLGMLLRNEHPRAAQSAGELGLLRHLGSPDDEAAKKLVCTALLAPCELTEHPNHLRIGIAYTAAEAWSVAEFRQRAHLYVLALLANDDADIDAALSEIFRVGYEDQFPPDQCTRELLHTLIEHPLILKQPTAEHLIEHLVRLIRLGWEPELIGQVAIALVGQVGDDLGNTATAWPLSAAALTDIVQLLQASSSPSSRAIGVELLERLLEYNLPAAGELLIDMDMRASKNNFVNQIPRRRPRTRRRPASR